MPDLNLTKNQTKKINLPIKKVGGFSSPTTFSVTPSSIPSGVSVSLSPVNTTGGGNLSVEATFTSSNSVYNGNYNVVFTGTPAPMSTLTVPVVITGAGTTITPTTVAGTTTTPTTAPTTVAPTTTQEPLAQITATILSVTQITYTSGDYRFELKSSATSTRYLDGVPGGLTYSWEIFNSSNHSTDSGLVGQEGISLVVSPGTYTAKLTVTNMQGAKGYASRSFTITSQP